MPTKIYSRLLSLLTVSLLPIVLMAQGSLSQLKNKRQKLEKEVELTSKLLDETRKYKSKSYSQLKLLNRKIQLQEKIVGSMEEEIKGIDEEIVRMNDLITAMHYDIKQYKINYGKAAAVAYKRQHKISVLLWVLGSENFSQAFDRLMYFRAFQNFRKDQVVIIRRTQKYLGDRKADYEARKQEKEKLLSEKLNSKKKLDRSKSKKNRLYNDLKKKERRYRSRLSEYRRSLNKLKKQIRDLIARSKSEAKTKAERDKIFKLSNSFEKNRTKLPWPIPMPQAVITGRYGRQRDASGGIVNNEGVYMSTSRGQSVRSIFEGTVTMISHIPSFGEVVIVQHGHYRSVYANLDKVFIQKGQKVETLQNIGTVKTDSKSGDTQLYFQIYKDFDPVNPERWIAGK